MYVKINLKWDYKNRSVTLSLPGYITMVLKQFRNKQTFKQQDSPHPYTAPKYGHTTQFSPKIPEHREIRDEDNKFLKQFLGALLYYGNP